MNLAKRLIRISAVTAAAVLMYEGAVTLDRTTEASASLQADASPNTKEKAPETDIINKETTAETETETKEETEVPVKNSSKKTTLSTEKSTEKKTPLKKETENETETESGSETSSETATETETEITTETESKTETESQTPGVTPEEESELASEGIRTETRSTEKDSELKYYLTSQYLLVPSFKNLKKDLNEMIDTYEGSWSIYVKDLKSGISLTINDRPQDSASLIKLYIAGAVLEEIQSQELEETDTIDQLLSDMISLSDNEAANELVRYLSDSHDHRDGMEKVNDFIEEHDFTDTHQYNGLEDSNLWYGDEVNVTSVKDCGRFLEEIYDGDMVSHLASRQLEGYLLNQDITWKIPAGIPSEIKTANKTGEKDNTQNDVSIVYTPYRDYIICVMATDLTDEDTAVENIRAVSGKVYEFFQEADTVTTENETESETEGGSSDVSDVGEDLEG
ncbi:serine hydrolase [Fusicatenibacter faecihominis]|uniref:Class A beta-lactamase-related serine hydrolase n=1 Tax=Fusicatenibacter faecihominis TaxID=2881276 RepID=A0AAE3J4D5_9FIRM|nr:serine hydrolase [Fusicatenibacter faecihominis]MCC2188338.1 class A beta-lactamase-related serine hydrolase [Fusicatenibacter faecihominis]